jgi:hypothetical protein
VVTGCGGVLPKEGVVILEYHDGELVETFYNQAGWDHLPCGGIAAESGRYKFIPLCDTCVKREGLVW